MLQQPPVVNRRNAPRREQTTCTRDRGAGSRHVRLLLAVLIATLVVGSAGAHPAPAALAQAGDVFVDSLRSGSLDPNAWEPIVQPGTNGSIQPQADGVHFKLLASNPSPSFSLNLKFKPVLRGDFDVSVDYRLVTWPARSGVRIGLNDSRIGNVSRSNPGVNEAGSDQHLTHFAFVGDGVAGMVPTSDPQGRLRFTRTGRVYAGYRWSGTSWVLLRSYTGQYSGDIVDLNFGMWSGASVWAGQDAEIVIENFRVSKGLLQPAPTGPYTLTDDFNAYATGQPPTGWDQFGTPVITPTIEAFGAAGNKVLRFPPLAGGQTDKFLLKNGLSCADVTATVKLNFRDGADAAGIVFAWGENGSNHIKVIPNMFWRMMQVYEIANGGFRTRIETGQNTLTIAPNTDYWLRVTATTTPTGEKVAIVYWSTNGTDYRTILTVGNLATISGRIGVQTQGFSLPHTYFDDFSVRGDCKVDGSVTLTPTSASRVAGRVHEVAAMIADGDGTPLSGIPVAFSVVGANPTSRVVLTGQTEAGKPSLKTGRASFFYRGTRAGDDTITVSAVIDGKQITAVPITVHWDAAPAGDYVLPVYIYKQSDPQWQGNDYGEDIPSNTSDIYEYGCFMTDWSMAARFIGSRYSFTSDPADLNAWLRNNDGYSVRYVSADLIPNYLASKYGSLKMKRESLSRNDDTLFSLIVARGIPVDLKVMNSDGGEHHVLAVGVTYRPDGMRDWHINDPLFGYSTLGDGYPGGYERMQWLEEVTPDDETGTLSIALASPAELLVTDPLGRRTGADPRSGAVYEEIPGATYSIQALADGSEAGGPSHAVKTFASTTPADGAYTALIIGTGNGSYTVTALGRDRQGQPTVTSSSGTASPGSVDAAQVMFASAVGSRVSLVIDSEPPSTAVVVSPNANTSSWHNTDVTVTLAAIDSQSAIARTEHNINGAGWVTYDGPLTIRTAGHYVLAYRSIDRVGNQETPKTFAINIDKTAPNAPLLTADRAPEYAGGGGWYRNTVTATFAANGDPKLADGTDGSGVDPSSVPTPVTRATSGEQTVTGSVKDVAGNVSAPASLTIRVDATPPTVMLACPTAPIVKGATASANWTAADPHSGLATPASGGVPLDTSSVGQKTAMLVAGAARDNVGLQSAVATCGYTVVYQFAGFFQPVDNPPTMNQGNAGRAVPVKFSLGGNQGLGIFAAGSPISQQVSCSTSAPISDLEETGTAGSSELTYDVSTDRYTYVWKTETSWAGTCRQLMVKLNDGAEHPALFRFR